jgi:hypothetical protein
LLLREHSLPAGARRAESDRRLPDESDNRLHTRVLASNSARAPIQLVFPCQTSTALLPGLFTERREV